MSSISLRKCFSNVLSRSARSVPRSRIGPGFSLPNVLSFSLSLLAIGCSSSGSAVSVEGTVTYRGDPVEKGAIRFIGEDEAHGAAGVGAIQGGRYHISRSSGMRSGRYLVSIYGFQKTGKIIKIDDSTPATEEERQFIPRQYNDGTTSRHQISPGENHLDFALE